jgi:hypothetical protein
MLTLPHNIGRDLALRELPIDANVVVFTSSASELQHVPTLKPGTAAKGRVDFGDQTGALRLKVGDCLLVLHSSAEVIFGHNITDPNKTELLVLAKNTKPLTAFDRAI